MSRKGVDDQKGWWIAIVPSLKYKMWFSARNFHLVHLIDTKGSCSRVCDRYVIGRSNDVSPFPGLAALFTYRGSKRSMSSPRTITDQAIAPSLIPTVPLHPAEHGLSTAFPLPAISSPVIISPQHLDDQCALCSSAKRPPFPSFDRCSARIAQGGLLENKHSV